MEKYDRFGSPSRPIRYQDRKPRESWGGGGRGDTPDSSSGRTDTSQTGIHRRKIRLTESRAKCRYLKKLTCKGTLRQVFICLRPPPLLGICLGWSSSFVGSESGQKQSVKSLQNMVSNTIQHPPPQPLPDPGSRIQSFLPPGSRGKKAQDPGSRIPYPDPQHCFLLFFWRAII